MFNASWGELVIVTGIGIALVGKKDLPVATKFLGKQVGRFVGALQGAKQKLDAASGGTSELRQLSAELKSGLRELDAVKTELAVASTMGRGLEGGIRPRSNTPSRTGLTKPSGTEFEPPNRTSIKSIGDKPLLGSDFSTRTPQQPASSPVNIPAYPTLAPRAHTVAAVAEEEWEKRGIGFKSRAERGTFGAWKANSNDGGNNAGGGQISGGASILDDLMRQGLIYDQYDRTVQEQDDILRSKAESRRKAAAANTDKRD